MSTERPHYHGHRRRLRERLTVSGLAGLADYEVVAPFLGGLAEKGDVQEVGFVGIDQRRLLPGNGGRDERLPDGIGVDA